jgi:hypothetical protein
MDTVAAQIAVIDVRHRGRIAAVFAIVPRERENGATFVPDGAPEVAPESKKARRERRAFIILMRE